MLGARDARRSLACRDAATGVLSLLRSPRCGDPLLGALGRRLRWLRVERQWSRKHVADRLRVPAGHVEGHERGTRPIEPRDLVAYARLFRVRISEFFKDPPTKGTA